VVKRPTLIREGLAGRRFGSAHGRDSAGSRQSLGRQSARSRWLTEPARTNPWRRAGWSARTKWSNRAARKSGRLRPGGWLEEPLMAQPVGTSFGPVRTRPVAFADTEIVGSRCIDVQLRRDAGSL